MHLSAAHAAPWSRCWAAGSCGARGDRPGVVMCAAGTRRFLDDSIPLYSCTAGQPRHLTPSPHPGPPPLGARQQWAATTPGTPACRAQRRARQPQPAQPFDHRCPQRCSLLPPYPSPRRNFGPAYTARAESLAAAIAANGGAITLECPAPPPGSPAAALPAVTRGPVAGVTTDAVSVIPDADVIVISLNGPAMGAAVEQIAPHLRPDQLLLFLMVRGGEGEAFGRRCKHRGAGKVLWRLARVLRRSAQVSPQLISGHKEHACPHRAANCP